MHNGFIKNTFLLELRRQIRDHPVYKHQMIPFHTQTQLSWRNLIDSWSIVALKQTQSMMEEYRSEAKLWESERKKVCTSHRQRKTNGRRARYRVALSPDPDLRDENTYFAAPLHQ